MPRLRRKAMALCLAAVLVFLSVVAAASKNSDDEKDSCLAGNGECKYRDPLKAQCSLLVAPSTLKDAGLGVFTTRELEDGDFIGFGDPVIPMENLGSSLPDDFIDYTWHGRVYRGVNNAYAPGLLSLTNSNMGLINVRQEEPASRVFADDRESSPYHYLQSAAATQIPPGSELFTYYGDHWWAHESRQTMPLVDDYLKAERLVRSFGRASSHLAPDVRRYVWEIVKSFSFSSNITKLLPEYKDVDTVVSSGMKVLHQPNATRSLEDLINDPSSRCADAIRPGPSPIHHLGAFATRDFDNGTVITGSPVIHTPKRRWNRHGQVWDSATRTYVDSQSTRTDYTLLVNYCWGHRLSSMLLCPYGFGITYINHGRNPNVRLQWPSDGEVSHCGKSLTQSPSELFKSRLRAVLALDVVAIRNIKKGEELVVDYGAYWEEFRKNHDGTTDMENISADVYNQHTTILTEAEQLAAPYPYNVKMKCHPDIIDKRVDFGRSSVWDDPVQPLDCQVLERYVNEQAPQFWSYAVRVDVGYAAIGRAGVPREYIHFFDNNKPRPFRLEMQLPDDMLPEEWKDLS